MAANKVIGVHAALCHDGYSARQGVEGDDLSIGSAVQTDIAAVWPRSILNVFVAILIPVPVPFSPFRAVVGRFPTRSRGTYAMVVPFSYGWRSPFAADFSNGAAPFCLAGRRIMGDRGILQSSRLSQ
jgi:hypothetical protein